MGYSNLMKFYAPDYENEQKENVSDYRSTLHWEPEIKTENGKASVTFYTSDQTGKYLVFVEGITNEGKISLGRAEFEVKD